MDNVEGRADNGSSGHGYYETETIYEEQRHAATNDVPLRGCSYKYKGTEYHHQSRDKLNPI